MIRCFYHKAETVTFFSSERSHHRRVISADHAIQMEEMRSDDGIQVGRERGRRHQVDGRTILEWTLRTLDMFMWT
jgi:hypothetical protein